MKRLYAILTCVALCFCFAACAKDNTDTSSEASDPVTETGSVTDSTTWKMPGTQTYIIGTDNVIGWDDPIDPSGETPASSSQKTSDTTGKSTDSSSGHTSSHSTATHVTDTEPLPPWTDSEYSRVVK